jgi:hypothetical protein
MNETDFNRRLRRIEIQIHTNTETDEITVSCHNFDDFSTADEVEAEQEAEAMAQYWGNLGFETYITRR